MDNPFAAEPATAFGAEPHDASLAVLLIHGRGQTADYMIQIARRLDLAGVAYRALSAHQSSWYPQGFMAPLADNQPRLGWALHALDQRVEHLRAEGFGRERIALVGFSQGACLACQYLLEHPGRFAALIALTGGLIGPEGAVATPDGRLDGTPILLSCGDADPWVPWPRVEETAAVFAAMGAEVTLRQFPGRGHEVCDAEIEAAREILCRR